MNKSVNKKYYITFLLSIFLVFNCKIEPITSTKFTISISDNIFTEPVSGRVILLISKTDDFRVSENGSPIFGVDFEFSSNTKKAIIDDSVLGFPLKSLNDIPAGEYYVKSIFNKYTTFNRSDGHKILLHNDNGEGQKWQRSPGNLYSDPIKVSIDPQTGKTINIVLNNIIPPIPLPIDTEYIKNIKIKSEILSSFWGQPMYLGAKILLPKGFNDNPGVKFPVIYQHGHFSTRNPGNFGRDSLFTSNWTSENFPRLAMVTMQHANPYYDDSYGVNSENMGPYGDAIHNELIPYIENNYRLISKPYSRITTGGSTGGWIALALQVWNPDFYGGTFSFYPDQVDFSYYQIVNILEDDNAYYTIHDWNKVDRPGRRASDGNIVYTMAQENLKEEVIGTSYRSGGQWAVWNALFAPVGKDGYPQPIWDPITGEINKVTANWAKENYDIRYYLENNWDKIGDSLKNKLFIFCGRMDNYYLNEAVYKLEEYLETTKNPYYDGKFEYGDKAGHGWSPYKRHELVKIIADHITNFAPEGENTDMWKY